MRRLLLMRHAKSSWADAGVDDHARPLNGRGRRDAPRMGRWMLAQHLVPDLALCSDAARAAQTWDAAREALGDVPTLVRPDFYHADETALVDALTDELPGLDDARTVIAIGHNPGWSSAVAYFSGRDPGLTTANIAVLEHPAQRWVDAVCDAGGWTLIAVARPKELDDG